MDEIGFDGQGNSDVVAMDIVGDLIHLDAANFDRDMTRVDADFVRVGSHPCVDAEAMRRVSKRLEDRAAISLIPSRDLVAMRRLTRLLVAALFVGLSAPAYVVWDKMLKPSSVSVSSERSERIDDLVEDVDLNLRTREGTALVTVVAEDGQEGKCAGIILNNRTIVLPKHAFEKDGQKFALKGIETGDFCHDGAKFVRSGSKCVWDQENENPYVLVEDPDTDVVVMRFGRPIEGVDEDRALPLADGKPGYGKEVLAVGHPGAVLWQAAYGFAC